MENERIIMLLSGFYPGKKITDVVLRSRDFSNDEIKQVETLGHIDCIETNAWGDRIYVISESGKFFKDQNNV